MQNIHTERLLLSQFAATDAAFIFELLNTPTWIQFIGERNINTLEDAENYIVQKLMPSYIENGFGFFAVKLKENNVPIGMCGFIKREGLDEVDIGFAFLPLYTGKGYAFEAAHASLIHAKDELKITNLLAITTKENEHSIRLLEKLGLVFEKNVYIPGDPEELMLFRKIVS